MEELSKAMANFADVNNQIKVLKTTKDELRTEILTILKTNDINDNEDEHHSVQYTINKRRTFDRASAIEFIVDHNVDPDNYFEETEFETLKVKSKAGALL